MADEKNVVIVELYDLSITERKDDRFAKVVKNRSIDVDNLIQMAVSRRTDLNPVTLKAGYTMLTDLAIECVLNGDWVKFGLAHFNLEPKGVLFGDNAVWDDKINYLVVNAIPTSEIREPARKAKVNVRGMATVGTIINSVTDVTTGELNTVLTAGGGVNLTGSKMRIAGDNPANGIYLIGQDTQDETLIPMTSVLINDPSKISFIVPSGLSGGEYKLKITTQFTSGNALLKEPRSYVFDYPLTV